MNSKTLSNYLVGAVAGLGLAIGSVAFAQNPVHSGDHHRGTTMGQTQQTIQNTMHDQVTQDGMHGQAVQQGFHGSMHSNSTQHAETGYGNINTHCNSAANNQDSKS